MYKADDFFRNRIEGVHLGLCHLRIGIFEKFVILEISNNSLYKAIFSTFLVILCISMHSQAIKSSIFTKKDKFLPNHINFSKFSEPAPFGRWLPLFDLWFFLSSMLFLSLITSTSWFCALLIWNLLCMVRQNVFWSTRSK